MQLTEIARIILLILLVVCAIGVNFGKSLLQAVIIAGPCDHGGGCRSGSQQCFVHAYAAQDPDRGPAAGGAGDGGPYSGS